MADHAAGSIPSGHGTMRMEPPQVVVGNRLHGAMALRAGFLGVADTACGIVLHAELAMPPQPCLAMAGRCLIWIHVDIMAGLAILSRSMRGITYIHNILAGHHRHGFKVFGQ